MSKLESTSIGLFVGIACPFLGFVAFWWTAALLHLQGFPVPEGMIKATALTGFGLGCSLDVIFLRRWVENFYTTNLRWMIVVYLGFFVVAFASFMGFPVGTFLLGIGAGIYVGRRESYHHQVDRNQLTFALHRTAILTSSITSVAALPIGILGLKDPAVSALFETWFGLDRNRLYGTAGFILVGLFCMFLFGAQYWCARKAGVLAFGLGPGKSPRMAAPGR